MSALLKFRRSIAYTLIAAMAALSVPVGPVHAAMVGTDEVIEQSDGSARDRVVAFLAREDVMAHLEALGVSPAQAQSRVAALSDKEVEAIAGKIDTLPAGEGAVGVIVGAAVLIFIILLITDLLGLTDVFGFTRKGSVRTN